jgi:hypothetical protein
MSRPGSKMPEWECNPSVVGKMIHMEHQHESQVLPHHNASGYRARKMVRCRKVRLTSGMPLAQEDAAGMKETNKL